MKNEEKKQSCYIDELNAGRKPKEHCKNIEDMEYVKLMNTVRIIMLTTAVAAAVAILFFEPKLSFPGGNTNIVYAMEQTKDIITVNNGELKWQLRPEEKTSYLFSTFPDHELTTGEVQIPSGISVKKPEIPVEVDLAVEENEQKSVDAGHSPWKLDPVFVAQVFASLLLSPEGIVGDYPISYEAIEMVENDGVKAIARINDDTSLAKYVYLERLVRQDETGIWTVIGYDKQCKR